MTCRTDRPRDAPGERPTPNPRLPVECRVPRPGRAAASLLGAAAAVCVLGTAACGWKTDYPGPSEIRTTSLAVEMQTQDGEPLGSKVLTAVGTRFTLTLADVGNRSGLSSKYIVVRKAPVEGMVGEWVASTASGSVSFETSSDGRPVKAIFMSTADLPESVMGCFLDAMDVYGWEWRRWQVAVGRSRPGSAPPAPGVTILDGDESILTNAIGDIDAALVDRQGVTLGRFSWVGDRDWPDLLAGFANVSGLIGGPPDPYGESVPYVLVNALDSREAQAMAALGELFDSTSTHVGPRCGAATGSYLTDPATGDRLSKQGVSILRFAAYRAK
jgi:hypothetical protein